MKESSLSPRKSANDDGSALLQRAQKGDADALKTLLAREKPLLYDYLMRMTGQMQRSLDTVEEVFLTVNGRVLHDVTRIPQLRGILIRTVRKFSLDVWNAGTSVLENAALPPAKKDSEGHPALSKQPTLQHLFDKAFRSLPGAEREVLWLSWNLTWDDEVIAEATFRTKNEIQELKNQAVSTMRAHEPALGNLTFDQLGALQVPHPISAANTGATIQLSHVMRGIRERPVKMRSWPRKVVFFLLLGLILAGVVNRHVIGVWFDQFLRSVGLGTTSTP